jgi:lipopolysaccharide transport system ATP-binding protein
MPASGIIFERVWKKFRGGESHDSLRDLIPSLAHGLFRGRRPEEVGTREFWVLKDVSFGVSEGEALGIIGPNGAGKSTILKLLTRILRPNRGHCALHGRAGALIEIAGGFHPDLTGRENIYFQGALMGMRRPEIERNFERIVEFSGIRNFIDTPVRRYSSGMNARLGFSIAAHLDPDVLLIDEILSVGDFEFQQRAFGHLQSVIEHRLPVIIVSHQLNKIAALCSKAILLEHGEVVLDGTPSECINAYLNRQEHTSQSDDSPSRIKLVSISSRGRDFVRSGERVTVSLEGSVAPGQERECEAVFVLVRSTDTGQILFQTSHHACGVELPSSGPLALEISLEMNVQPGVYMVESLVRDPRQWRILAEGPRTFVQVMEGKSFRGLVQMNPAMHLCDGPSRD